MGFRSGLAEKGLKITSGKPQTVEPHCTTALYTHLSSPLIYLPPLIAEGTLDGVTIDTKQVSIGPPPPPNSPLRAESLSPSASACPPAA